MATPTESLWIEAFSLTEPNLANDRVDFRDFIRSGLRLTRRCPAGVGRARNMRLRLTPVAAPGTVCR